MLGYQRELYNLPANELGFKFYLITVRQVVDTFIESPVIFGRGDFPKTLAYWKKKQRISFSLGKPPAGKHYRWIKKEFYKSFSNAMTTEWCVKLWIVQQKTKMESLFGFLRMFTRIQGEVEISNIPTQISFLLYFKVSSFLQVKVYPI